MKRRAPLTIPNAAMLAAWLERIDAIRRPGPLHPSVRVAAACATTAPPALARSATHGTAGIGTGGRARRRGR